MLELRQVQTVHFVMRGLYGPEPVNSYADLGEAITKAVSLKAAEPDAVIYVESRSYLLVAGA